MHKRTIFRGPIGFTPVESRIAAGLAALVLVGTGMLLARQLTRSTPQVYFETYTIPVAAQADSMARRSPNLDGHTKPPPASQVGDRLNINAADYAELLRLPGIGPVLATRIIEYRDRNGPFLAVDSLIKVSGIGPKKLQAIRSRVFAR